jgi:hypothetical protein
LLVQMLEKSLLETDPEIAEIMVTFIQALTCLSFAF